MVVFTPEGSFNVTITKSTTGQELLNNVSGKKPAWRCPLILLRLPPQVIARLELTHVPLYGLQYTDHKDYQTFLKPDKKVRSQREKEKK